MANEAVNLELPRIIKRFTIYDTPAIPLNTLMKMSTDLHVAASSSTDVFAGICIEEKTTADGITNLGLAKDGVWDLYAGGGSTISVGELVKLSGANTIEGDVVEADIIAGKVVGKAYEAVAIGTPETIRVDVGVIV